MKEGKISMRGSRGWALLLPLLFGCNGTDNSAPPGNSAKTSVTMGEHTHPIEIVSLSAGRKIARLPPDGKARLVISPRARYQYWKLARGWTLFFLSKEDRLAEAHSTTTGGDAGITSSREYERALLLSDTRGARLDSKVHFEGIPSSPAIGALEKLKLGEETVYFERAASSEERQDGLMWRKNLSENDGMLFVYPQPDWRRFWMGNCLIDLDIAFFREDRSLINVVEMKRYPDPSSDPGDRAASDEPAKYVLEVSYGWFRKRNLTGENGKPLRDLRFEYTR